MHTLSARHPREMISNARTWAAARNLLRVNEVHRAEEFKVPTESSYSYVETRRQESTRSGTFEAEDDGSLLDFSGLSADAAITHLVGHDVLVHFRVHGLRAHIGFHAACEILLRRGSSSGTAGQVAMQSASTSKVQSLPMVQQNQDPFCSLFEVDGGATAFPRWTSHDHQ